MTYIPKNRMITNLYTNTKELVYKDTKEDYLGHYWKTYDGKYFSGKNPNDTPTRELIKTVSTEEDENILITTSQIAVTDAPTVLSTVDSKGYNEEEIITYANIQKINLNDIPKKIVPKHLYPKPTDEDYKLGVFDRYFLYKQNEPIFLEVNKDIYDGVKGKDPKYYFTPYTTFKLPWTITGDKGEAFKTNKKIVELTEKRINRRGLKQFLNGNFTKFCLSE